MIYLKKIKSIPDEKPRKGPARMGKSEKSPAQERWKRYYSQLRQIGACGITGIPTRRVDDRLSRSIHDKLRVVRRVEQILRDVEESLNL